MQADEIEGQATYYRQFFEALQDWDKVWRTTLDFVGDEEYAVSLGLDQVGHFGPRGVTLVAKRLVESTDGALNHVIELGSGFGGSLRCMERELKAREMHPWLVGIELVHDHCELAAAIGRSIGSNSSLVLHADACSTPLPSMDADAIFVTGSASHFARIGQVFAECYRLLRPGGLLVMTEEVSLRPQNAPAPSDAFVHYHPPQVFYASSPEKRRAELTTAGLTIEVFEPIVDWAGPLLRQRVQMLRLMGHCATQIFGEAIFEQMVGTLASAADEYARGSILPMVIVARRASE